SRTIDEDETVILTAADFGPFADVDGDSFAGVRITGLPLNGTVQYFSGGLWLDVAAGQDISAAEIGLSHLRFVPDLNESGTANAIIGFKVFDGIDLSVATYNLTLD